MERKTIKSGAISEVGYDADSGVLEILFPSGALWRYSGVPVSDYEGFLRAESAGHFFAVAIRACYQSHRVHTDGLTHEAKCGDVACWCAKLTKTSRDTEAKDGSNQKSESKKTTRKDRATKTQTKV
jgi:KTSC domain-containing protein